MASAQALRLVQMCAGASPGCGEARTCGCAVAVGLLSTPALKKCQRSSIV
jgi:hypothetical protein